jgi:hypothetical protein
MIAASTKARVIDDRPSAPSGSLNQPNLSERDAAMGSAPQASAPLASHSDGADAVSLRGSAP